MTLGELIETLELMDQDRVLRHGFLHPHSYRGYYDQLAFEPVKDVPVRKILQAAKGAVGATFTGYKGGDYEMHEWTEVWLARRGNTGEPLTHIYLENRYTIAELLEILDRQCEPCAGCAPFRFFLEGLT